MPHQDYIIEFLVRQDGRYILHMEREIDVRLERMSALTQTGEGRRPDVMTGRAE